MNRSLIALNARKNGAEHILLTDVRDAPIVVPIDRIIYIREEST